MAATPWRRTRLRLRPSPVSSTGTVPPGITTDTSPLVSKPRCQAAQATAAALEPEDAVAPSPRSKTRAANRPSPRTAAHWRFTPAGHGSPSLPSLPSRFADAKAIRARAACSSGSRSASMPGSLARSDRKVTQCGLPTRTNTLQFQVASSSTNRATRHARPSPTGATPGPRAPTASAPKPGVPRSSQKAALPPGLGTISTSVVVGDPKPGAS